MKKLLILALVVFAAWTAWQRAPGILKRPAIHHVVVDNQSRLDVTRVRVQIGSQTFVKESLPSGESVTFDFRVSQEERLSLLWVWKVDESEDSWSGGQVTKGPIAQRHVLTIMDRGSVMHRVQRRLEQEDK